MRKGERRRQQILEAAERLFVSRGYDATTVQDILDDLELSKGGFYHHFESKEQLLAAICESKVEQLGEKARRALASGGDSATERINAVLDAASLWQEPLTKFLSLYIRVAYRSGNALMREAMAQAIGAEILPLVNEAVQYGVKRSEFFTPHPEQIDRLVLTLLNMLNDDIAHLLLDSGVEPPSTMRLLDTVDLYRHATERLLDAPYGSVTLYDMSRLAQATGEIWSRLKRMERSDAGML